MNVLSIDIGFGDTKVVYGTDYGEVIKKFKFPTIVGITQKLEHVENDKILGFENNYYLVGENARHLPSENFIDVSEYKNLEFFAPLFLHTAIEMLKINSDDIDLIVTGLSIAQINNSGYFQNRLKSYTISGVEYIHEKVIVLPQGAGCKILHDKFGLNYPTVNTEFLGDKTYIIADIGNNTCDFLLVSNGKTDPNLFQGLEKTGIMLICQKIAKLIAEKHSRNITVGEAKQILDEGVYKLRGQRYYYDKEISEYKQDYLKELIKLIEGRFPSIIDKIEFILLVGGGARIFNNSSNDGFIRVPLSEHEFYNALGFYFFGVDKLKQKDK